MNYKILIAEDEQDIAEILKMKATASFGPAMEWRR